MKSSKASTLKGQANQIIKQIVKVVLPSDVVQLQPGRRKKPKKGTRKLKKDGVKAPRIKEPRGTSKPPSGNLPRAPEGFLSHNIRQDKPQYPSVFGDSQPRSFAQQTFQPPPSQSLFEKMIIDLTRDKGVKKEEVVSPMPVKKEEVLSPVAPIVQSAMSLKQALQSPSRIPVSRSRSRSMSGLWGIHSNIIAEEIPSPPPVRGAPNQANQPSVDVNGEGKEAEILRPQTPSISLAQASLPARAPYLEDEEEDIPLARQVSSQASASVAPLDAEQIESNINSRKSVLRDELQRLQGLKFSARERGYIQKKAENERKMKRIREELEELM